jgi:hypothetical protein
VDALDCGRSEARALWEAIEKHFPLGVGLPALKPLDGPPGEVPVPAAARVAAFEMDQFEKVCSDVVAWRAGVWERAEGAMDEQLPRVHRIVTDMFELLVGALVDPEGQQGPIAEKVDEVLRTLHTAIANVAQPRTCRPYPGFEPPPALRRFIEGQVMRIRELTELKKTSRAEKATLQIDLRRVQAELKSLREGRFQELDFVKHRVTEKIAKLKKLHIQEIERLYLAFTKSSTS